MVARAKTSLTVFENTRTTFQRLSDAKICHGWVLHFDSTGLLVRLSVDSTVLNVNDECYFQVFGPQRNALFKAKLTAVEESGDDPYEPKMISLTGDGVLYRFLFVGQVKILETEDSARFVNQCMNAAISSSDSDGSDEPCPVIDVSMKGLSVTVHHPLDRGKEARVTIYTPLGRVDCKVVIRYCRKLAEMPGAYRVGMEILTMDRIDEKRWQAVFRRIA
ncbi:MAG TPA: PilZ domain-containing protein [Fimbriimonadaceae bacterium]|nr:PilZ domain-containing protein [Fimbriimonadaceae bacterium]